MCGRDNKQAIGMYDWFQSQAISALPTLQESLTETVMRHIFGRIEETPRSSDILLNMALRCAEKAVTCFDNTSGLAAGMLIQVSSRTVVLMRASEMRYVK